MTRIVIDSDGRQELAYITSSLLSTSPPKQISVAVHIKKDDQAIHHLYIAFVGSRPLLQKSMVDVESREESKDADGRWPRKNIT